MRVYRARPSSITRYSAWTARWLIVWESDDDHQPAIMFHKEGRCTTTAINKQSALEDWIQVYEGEAR